MKKPIINVVLLLLVGPFSEAGVQASETRMQEKYGKLPLSFEANRGQADPRVKFLSRGRGYGLFLTSAEAILTLGHATEADVSGPASARSKAAGKLTPVRTKRDSAAQKTASLRMS